MGSRIMDREKLKKKLLHYRKVNERQCWIWTLGINPDNKYGIIKIDGSMKYIHRLSAEFWLKDFNPELCVLHKCDVRRCFNPEHLFQGTKKDNIKDMDRKGRRNAAKGNQMPQAKLNPELVYEIRNRLSQGQMQKDIAEFLGLTRQNVNDVSRGKTWKHI